MKNVIHWGRKELVESNQLSYYDQMIYRVPYSGTFSQKDMWNALIKRYFPYHHNVFGGYCSLESVSDNGDGTIKVAVLYHIGE